MNTKPLGDRYDDARRGGLKIALAVMLAVLVTGCSSLGAAGPSGGNIRSADSESYEGKGIEIVELDGRALARLDQYGRSFEFAEVFTEPTPSVELIGYGDVLDIGIWEAPPAVLFGGGVAAAGTGLAPQAGAFSSVPQQVVGEDGTVSVPFVGPINVIGRKVSDVERAIVRSLRGRAHDPQAIVRLVRNETTVTVLGEVAQSKRMPLSARGERVLDALASAGGTRNPVDRSIVQITRGNKVVAMPLSRVVTDADQNVKLLPDDVVTVLFQPFSFVALGAVRQSAEVPFDGSGLSLAQALGRVGGLNDGRADVKGVFVFRLEDREAFGDDLDPGVNMTADGRVPVIYRLNLSDPASLFAMQDFAIRDDDVLYVSTAPGADLQRFVSTISSAAFSVIGITNALSTNNN
ncbi:polysaccharide export protein [Erythrobacter sp. SCSIO 43205]|uniref:polysaccharide biosynthesis/export family protein n=1 Tax=Erythrobacter sp. SCSIO 43205 TaxID=2779361 RepID=UPI001CA90C39|nr:polysaccharide biosynthesis/export family protein [Erythrobacter sp. SCSIO 43205]UAB77807.1 polysaccharide export protein [Erythrobacter sp. SCSIO 43205]